MWITKATTLLSLLWVTQHCNIKLYLDKLIKLANSLLLMEHSKKKPFKRALATGHEIMGE